MWFSSPVTPALLWRSRTVVLVGENNSQPDPAFRSVQGSSDCTAASPWLIPATMMSLIPKSRTTQPHWHHQVTTAAPTTLQHLQRVYEYIRFSGHPLDVGAREVSRKQRCSLKFYKLKDKSERGQDWKHTSSAVSHPLTQSFFFKTNSTQRNQPHHLWKIKRTPVNQKDRLWTPNTSLPFRPGSASAI